MTGCVLCIYFVIYPFICLCNANVALRALKDNQSNTNNTAKNQKRRIVSLIKV